MLVSIALTDDQKRVLRYLGISQSDFSNEVRDLAAVNLAVHEKNARQRWAAKKKMIDISPEPLS